jgi:hypothetical protein
VKNESFLAKNMKIEEGYMDYNPTRSENFAAKRFILEQNRRF